MIERDRKRVLVAFSGGIDSCAAVGILRGMGYEVEALTIDMLGDEALLHNARERAEQLSIKLHVYDGREVFEQEIVHDFIFEYLAGRTPAPCTRCNTLIKWELLARVADELGIYYIATGHYFRLEERSGRYYVSRALDPIKDQSYYLWGVRQELLERALTPMGERIKAEVKKSSDIKRESMGICFLHGRHYTDFICDRCGDMNGGDVIDSQGDIAGRHNGIARYTIGQKRGEGIPAGVRVTEIIAENNQIKVDLNETLFKRKLHIERCNFVDVDEITQIESSNLTVMVRGLGLNPEGGAKISITKYGAMVELLDDSAWAAAPGQPVVLYSGNCVVGGGYLIKAE